MARGRAGRIRQQAGEGGRALGKQELLFLVASQEFMAGRPRLVCPSAVLLAGDFLVQTHGIAEGHGKSSLQDAKHGKSDLVPTEVVGVGADDGQAQTDTLLEELQLRLDQREVGRPSSEVEAQKIQDVALPSLAVLDDLLLRGE